MFNSFSSLRYRVIVAVSTALFSLSCAAQSYPSKPIKLVVPFPPGGVADLVARPLAAKLATQLGQSVVVENKGGATGTIGASFVASAPPDGYTLLLGTTNEIAMSPTMFKSLPYDPIKAFAPITPVAEFPNVLVVGPSVAATNLDQFISFVKSNPGKVSFASSGRGSTNHLTAEVFKSLTKTDILHVPYKGGGPALIDLLGGHVDAMFATLPSAMSYIKEGKLRALVVTGEHRSPALPNIPTGSEAGLPGLVVTTWNGVLAPAGTPAEVVAKLHSAIQKVSSEADLREKYAAIGAETVSSTPEEFQATIGKDFTRWSQVIKQLGPQ